MSKDNVKNMFAKFEKDGDLKKKYAEIMKNYQKENENSLAELLIEFGKKSGFAFSKDDLMAARIELTDKTNSNKELSDNDLTRVAGGGHKNSAIILSLITLGIGCAVNSLIREQDSPGECGKMMSTTVKC